MRTDLIAATALATGLALSAPAAGAPMVTALDTIRKQATTIVVGVVTDDGGNLAVDVEYAVRGAARAGRMPVGESPDGHVFLGTDPSRRPRVLALIDDQKRLRWVGELVAGPDLEHGVIRLHGFFDYNAHVVEPGLLTLAQLEHYLSSGDLVQQFRARLTFPDRKGGLEVTDDRFEVEYDAIARTTGAVRGLTMACLGHPQLTSPAWGDFRLFFYCRKRQRTLTLAGGFTGVDAKTGAILVDVAPLSPFLYRDEFATYIGDPAITGVDRRVDVKLGDGATWHWQVEDRLIDPKKGVHRARGQTVGSSSGGGQRSTYRIYRFAGVALKITYTESRPGWASDTFSLLQLVDRGAIKRCGFRHAGKHQRCRLRPASPVWTRDRARKAP